MRAKEFIVNVPVRVRVNDAGELEDYTVMSVDLDNKKSSNTSDDDQQNAYMSPQQQELELKKVELGKSSPAGEQLLDDPDEDEIA